MTIAIPGLLLVALALSPTPPEALPPVHFADLKSFFHGEPAPFVKAPPPKQLAAVSTAPGTVADPQVESFLRTLADALMAREAGPVLKRLSDRYAVEGVTDEAKPADLMAQAIGKMRGPTRIVIRSVSPATGVRTAQVEFHHGPDRVDLKTFRFDAAGNLLASDLFRVARG